MATAGIPELTYDEWREKRGAGPRIGAKRRPPEPPEPPAQPQPAGMPDLQRMRMGLPMRGVQGERNPINQPFNQAKPGLQYPPSRFAPARLPGGGLMPGRPVNLSQKEEEEEEEKKNARPSYGIDDMSFKEKLGASMGTDSGLGAGAGGIAGMPYDIFKPGGDFFNFGRM